MSKTIKDALEAEGFKAKVRRDKTKRWPRKRGQGKVTITITIDRKFKPGTGFAINFIEKEEK